MHVLELDDAQSHERFELLDLSTSTLRRQCRAVPSTSETSFGCSEPLLSAVVCGCGVKHRAVDLSLIFGGDRVGSQFTRMRRDTMRNLAHLINSLLGEIVAPP